MAAIRWFDTVRAALLVVVFVSGCVAGPAGPEPSTDAGDPLASFAATYGCPGEPAQDALCFSPWARAPESFGDPSSIAPDAYHENRLAVLQHTPVPAGPGAPVPEAAPIPIARTEVAVSTDGGRSFAYRLVAHGVSPEHPNGALWMPTALWTREGVLVVAAFLSDRPNIVAGTSGAGAGVAGQAWIGWSGDEGATWTTASVQPGHGGSESALHEAADGALFAVWSSDRGYAQVQASRDGGRTWSAPVSGGACIYPNVIGEMPDGLVISCDARSGWSFVDDVTVQEIDLKSGEILSVREVDVPGDESCSTAGPVAAGEGALVAATACDELSLVRSTDAGRTWQPFGVPAPVGFARSASYDVSLVVAPNGVINAISQHVEAQASTGCCDGQFQVVAWSPSGELIANEMRKTWEDTNPLERVDSVGTGAYPAIGMGPEKAWILAPAPAPALGWVQGSQV